MPTNLAISPSAPDYREQRLSERRARYRTGLWGEFIATIVLPLKGYRILARRYKTHCGEIDLVAVRGDTVCFVEVKARATLEAAEASITRRQSERIRRAAGLWIARSPRYQHFEQRFDALYVLPRRWPVHLPGGA